MASLIFPAPYLQDKSGIRAGKFQMVVDARIVTASLWVVSPADAAGLYPRRRDLNSIIASEPTVPDVRYAVMASL